VIVSLGKEVEFSLKMERQKRERRGKS
jgi:hypothetical protein